MQQFITEREILLISRRKNSGKSLDLLEGIYNDAVETGEVRVYPDQVKKGFDWLWNLYKTPKGIERKNNPFGYREQEALESGCKSFTYDGHFNAGNAYHDFFVPMYTFTGKDGQSFQYYVSGGVINIIG